MSSAAKDALDGGALRDVFDAYERALDEHRDFLNRVNVYPVADGDTGTNMLVTIRSALEAAGDAIDLVDVAAKLSHGAVMGGRGNSGIILSQIVKGMLSVVVEGGAFGAVELGAGLQRGRALAYDAVADPIEGTILSAVTAAAGAVGDTSRILSLAEIADAAHRAVDEAVVATTGQLEQLTRAGVVDGGAKGFALLLDALLFVIEDRALPAPPPLPPQTWDAETSAERWEVVLVLDAADDQARSLKDEWSALGSSIVVSSEADVHKCHVHTDDYSKAIDIARSLGRVSDIAVTELVTTKATTTIGARVCIAGDITDPLKELFDSLDASGPPAPIAIVPVDADGSKVEGAREVVHVDGLPQALAAALAHDPDLPIDQAAARMRDAAAAVRTVTAHDLDAAAEIVENAADAEVATVFVGADFDPDEVTDVLQPAAADIAIEVYPTGRATPAFEIGLE